MDADVESRLLARCVQGDPAAWDELFSQHYDATCRFIWQLSNDFSREDAQEICQETFLSVIRNLKSFNRQSRFQTWLFRIAANKARDYREKLHAAKRGGGQQPISLQHEDPDTGLTLDPPAATPGPDSALLASERAELVYQGLEQLGEPCRQVIDLRYFGNLSYEEISRSLGLNVKTVSSRLSKCLDRLEEILRRMVAGEQSPVFPSNLQ